MLLPCDEVTLGRDEPGSDVSGVAKARWMEADDEAEGSRWARDEEANEAEDVEEELR